MSEYKKVPCTREEALFGIAEHLLKSGMSLEDAYLIASAEITRMENCQCCKDGKHNPSH